MWGHNQSRGNFIYEVNTIGYDVRKFTTDAQKARVAKVRCLTSSANASPTYQIMHDKQNVKCTFVHFSKGSSSTAASLSLGPCVWQSMAAVVLVSAAE